MKHHDIYGNSPNLGKFKSGNFDISFMQCYWFTVKYLTISRANYGWL